ncbi:MAG: hypothetical protein JNJ70_09820 [Verrucomicrobiales bacterium]|nr:hypothetical protein [Verrucomicrobiales bacterium]
MDSKGRAVSENRTDRVTSGLIEEGYRVEPARLNPSPWSMIVGMAVVGFDRARITYRVEAGGAVIHVLFYELLQPAGSLRNSFAGFVGFLDWLATRPVGIERLQGAVHSLGADGDRALSTERIARYYKQILCGRTLEWRDGQEVIYTEIASWRQFRGIRAFP